MTKTRMSTLCYIQRNEKYLMLHRIVKENDINKDKWIGVGGHFEDTESPEECLIREVREETGYILKDFDFRGIVTFVYGDIGDEVVEYMHLFTAENVDGEPGFCDEGVLEWVTKNEIMNLDLWEGDKIFLKLLDEDDGFFSLKLVYNAEAELMKVLLNGKDFDWKPWVYEHEGLFYSCGKKNVKYLLG